MIFYMLKDKATGLFYKRGPQSLGNWVPQEEASVWTLPSGPSACIGGVKRYARRSRRSVDPEVVEIHTPKVTVVTIVDGDDWEGLYIDGKLIEEHHCVRTESVLQHLGIPCEMIYPDQNWLENRGNLPVRLEDVKRD